MRLMIGWAVLAVGLVFVVPAGPEAQEANWMLEVEVLPTEVNISGPDWTDSVESRHRQVGPDELKAQMEGAIRDIESVLESLTPSDGTTRGSYTLYQVEASVFFRFAAETGELATFFVGRVEGGAEGGVKLVFRRVP